MQAAREKLPRAVTELDWSEITSAFMRFAAISYLDVGTTKFYHIADMCSTDLLVENTYAEMQNTPLFGTTQITKRKMDTREII